MAAFFKTNHSTQSYFIIQKRGSFQKCLKSLVWGILMYSCCSVFLFFFLKLLVNMPIFISAMFLVNDGLLIGIPTLWRRAGASAIDLLVTFQNNRGPHSPVPWPSKLNELLAIYSSVSLFHSATSPFILFGDSMLIGSYQSLKPGLEVTTWIVT